uniref:NpnC n=1 Tax=Kaarinaea lacus PCC 9237 TaxID=3158555 RepID=G9CIA3_9CYAN|nr:NpnC [Nostoc sp. 152]
MTKSIVELVRHLTDLSIDLETDGNRLRCHAPEGALTPILQQEIAKRKTEIILFLQQAKQVKASHQLPIPRVPRNDHLPLSFAQARLWFLYELEGASATYNMVGVLKLSGSLNVDALKQATGEILQRHEVLRTRFQQVDGIPVQVIDPNPIWNLPIVDLQQVSQPEAEAQRLATLEAQTPFDLSQSPLLRLTLLKLQPQEHLLLINIHHIVSDGWSNGIFIRELSILYAAFCTGEHSLGQFTPTPLPELPIQYADFAIWQRQWLSGDVLAAQLGYWKQQLAGAPPLLELPTDRPRPAVQTFKAAIERFQLDSKLTDQIRERSQKSGSTLFMTLLAGFVVLLFRYSGQTDLVVGSPIANRNRREIEGLIGFFVNTLALRFNLSQAPTFEALLAQVRQVTQEAYDHQDLPFEILVEQLQPERNLDRNPLVQVLFALQNAPTDSWNLPGLKVEDIPWELDAVRVDLEVHLEETPSGIEGVCCYNNDLFDAATISRMMQHFENLLEGIVANPQQPVALLPLLTHQERHQLLVEWNNTQVDYAQELCIHKLFESQVERTPDSVAVVFENQQLTYGELNSRANQLAHHLRSLGVGADVLVGICVERSIEMVVGLLGILKAGGAYVPLDSEYPTERLAFMLEDAQVSVLLTQQNLVEKLPPNHAQLVCLDNDWQIISQLSQENLVCGVQENNLGYVIYTSGSTGQPKGVAMNQLALCNLMLWQLQNTSITSSKAKTLQFAPISFDVSFQEMFSTWCSGGTLLLIDSQLRREPLALLGLLKEQGVERVFLPFVALQQLAEVAVDSELVINHLKEVITAGEQLQITPAISKWFSQLNGCTLHNHYGPSESHVVTTLTLSDAVENWALLPPIGRPITNTQIYILDEYLQPVPIGVPGELHIGGVCLARGYLNRPELTQERFIPNPFNNSKLYKTGDLARYLPDGNIEYLGRIDNQVKIRGFRIELGEVEAVLSQCEDVQVCCAMAREDSPGDKRLVAYIVPQPQITPTVSELRSFLKSKLPEYMVPSAIVILESLPLTPNGKVDRRALPAPEPSSELSNKFVAPRTPIEEILALIWTQVLKVEQVGIYDNFFELGGHSLLATQLISRIRTSLKVELPLRSLFAAPTIAELSQNIQQLQQQDLELSAPPILPRVDNAEIASSYSQQRLWFLDQLQPNSAFYNIPGALRLSGTLEIAALEQSFHEIIQRHQALRTNFITVDGQATPIIQTEANWTISIVDLQHLSTTEQEIASQQLTQQQALLPFDLATEALIRATLVVLSDTEHLLFVCMHHIVSDGWSMGVFVQELTTLYNSYSQGQPSPLTPLPIQYADFAIWQRQWLQGDVLQSQLSYWEKQLASAPTFLPLPTDRPRPAVQTFAGAYQEFSLSVNLTQKLTKLSQEQGVTLFMTLLAAYGTLLYRYTGVEDILVGSPIANRDRSETEELIGFFVNTLVLRTDISGNPSFNELLPRIREMALGAYAHQDLPFEMLVEALQPERDLSHTPLFQVMFTLQNAPISTVELTGLNISPLPIESATAKFDLTLAMENTANGLIGAWEYNTDLFDSSTIERITGHFVTLLEAIVTNPQERISQLPMLTTSEQQQLLVEWNNTQVDYSHDLCIHELFESQVKRTPNAVAVVFQEQQLTYQQLNSRANQLAHYLRSLGVRAEVLVGICVERSLEMLIGLLGILKAGGAYLPLDPEYPIERLTFMLEDAQVSVLLTQQHLVEKLPPNQAQLVCIDEVWQEILQNKQDNLTKVVTPFNLANVIYTSGSTGKPKGVMVEHRGLCNLAQAQIQTFSLHSDSRILQFASFSFDASIWEVLMAFGSGATLYLGTKDSLMPGTPLIDRLTNDGITHITLPPSALLVLPEDELPALQTIIVAGEACAVELMQQWSTRRNFFNAYGPTEASVCATVAKCTPNDQKVSIGRPIANTQIYILDQHLQPVPIGVPGELHIGGAGLARGYLNRPELTQEKFIPNPFNNSKLYKTGDLARYLPDGNIEYLGRIDNQVKIRGFRIELGEIETILNQHQNIQTSCVIAHIDNSGDKRLIAYIVPQPQATPTIDQLRSHIKTQLPEYMIPSAIIILESLPLTPNGKIDRRALPAPEFQSQPTEKFVAPRTPVEEILALTWTQILRIEIIGIHDNFFELGGHSLLATQLISRIRSNLQIELPLRSLFAAPTIAQLAQNIQQLQQNHSEISAPPINPRTTESELPLSYSQQRLWFLDKFEPNSASYNIPIALRLLGTLQITALEQSLHQIIQRHSALRTNFITVNGQPSQIIQTQTNWTISVIDLQNLSTTEQEITSQELSKQQAHQPFNLATESLITATLVIIYHTEHLLLVCMHHIVSDGWSMGIFVQETHRPLQCLFSRSTLTLNFTTNTVRRLRNLAKTMVSRRSPAKQTQLLATTTSQRTHIPTTTHRPPQTCCTDLQRRTYEFALCAELTQKLTKLSQQQGVTLFMTLLAAYGTLLYRYTGVADILIGSPIANRERSEIEGLIGFFVNSLVLRTDISGNPSFGELLPRIREMALGAYAHQDLPFEMLVEALQPERNLGHTPLFQVMFVLQNAPISTVELNGLTVNNLPMESATAKFDLTLAMESTSTGLVGGWEYNTDLFDSSTIERMTNHFLTLLTAIVANPQQKIDQLPMLTASEQQQLLVEWNQTQTNYPHNLCIHQLFELQSLKTPDAVAVVCGNQQITYRELNSRANQLAHYLQSLGVKAEVLVGICVERSLEMLVGLLAILKAGGAYLPLDPEYPQERLSFMLEDTQVKVLLTQNKLVESLGQHQARVICLDTDWQSISLENQHNLNTTANSQNLCYVIYTSGSTGTPKGVAVTHQAVNRLVKNTNYIQFTPDDRVAQAANIAFDAATFEIWGALLHGAKLVIIAKSVLFSPPEFAVNIRQQEVSVLFLTTALFNQLASFTPQVFSSLRYLLFGGEAVDPRWVREVLDKGAPQKLLHVYGPTENTTFSSWYLVEDLPSTATTIPIGQAISNTQLYILDQNLQPVPVGVPGELHIGGVGLAREYLNRPELTQEKFIPNPFGGSRGGERLYKTGDLARYLPDGNIEYLGRIDNQVKIRGFRIELGEIEASLNQHPDVQTSCVIARVDIPGNKRLVAYIVPQPQITPTVSELRSFLKTKLPDYMIPSAIMILESLPLTPNGKIDRRALPEPESRAGIETLIVQPRNSIEETLAQIWMQVLRVESIGIHDNFFELGGDSILSIQIISRAKLAGLELTVKQLFANQTIAQLATVAGTIKALSIEQGLVSGACPLTPIQQWFFEQDLPEKHYFNQSFLLTVPSDIKLEVLEQVWQELLKHHDALRLRFSQKDSIWQQIHANPSENFAISRFDLSTVSESEMESEIATRANELQASLNLSENLVQVALFWLGSDKEARLLIVIHHLVVDGVSWRILLEDLQTGYEQLSQGQMMQLPEKTMSFKDWAQQLREYAQSDVLKSELAYWLSASHSAISPIPVDYEQGENTFASGSTVSVWLDEAETLSLLQDVPKAYKTQINDVLLTALVVVLSRWTNSNSVLFNLEGHGREDVVDGVDLSRTVGWFTTIFPVVVELELTDDLGSVLKSVKEQLRGIPNKGIGYGLLRYLNGDAEVLAQLDRIGASEVSFNYLGQFAQVLNTSSLMQLAGESSGQSQSLQGRRSCLLDVNAIITDERLYVDWAYSSYVHQRSTIESVAEDFIETLRDIIAHCLSPHNSGYTPTDFPLIQLSQLELDGVMAGLRLKPEIGKTNWQNIEDIYPLSPMQEGMLFESLYAPDSGVYLEQMIYTLTGSIDVEAFSQAWQQVVARHSIFRTAFVWESLSQPLQVVYRQVNVTVDTIDWRELSAQEQQAQLETFLDFQRQQSFQLSQAPLMHLRLVQLDSNTYQFVWSFHHLLLDGWSLPLVLKDLLDFYQAISQDESLPNIGTVNYRNYIAWLQQQNRNLAEEFWREKLQGFTAPTPITVDKPLSNRQQDSTYSEQEIQLTVSATDAIASFVRQYQLTINNLVQVTWGLLLSRYSQETDVVFGATVSGRPPSLIGVESMVGLFINTLPVRVQISETTELLSLLKDLQAQQFDSEQFSYSSLVEIQALSDVPKGTSLFESIVVFENYPVDTAALRGNDSFAISNFEAIEQTNYPLTVLAASGEQFLLKVIYDASRFEDGTISRMLGHFVTLLEAIVENPQQRISELPILTQVEKQQLLVEWNNTQVDYPHELCIHKLFEEQVERTPDEIAVVFENQQLTYSELNTRANQLAHYLQSLGVGADVLVGICVERSIEMVVGLLGILKAGGAYVPLDPEYPIERLSFMLSDAAVSVLLTQQQLVEKLPPNQARVIYLDSDWQIISQLSQENVISGVQENNLGYVIYTSGSTGQPKGVAMNQLALCNLILWQLQNTSITSSKAKTLQFAPISFDVSFQEMFSTWCSGGTLLLIDSQLRREPLALLGLLQEQAVERVFVPFVALQQLAEVAVSNELVIDNLREIITAGEQLQITPAISKWFGQLNGCTLNNHYGPSESHVVTTFTLSNSVDNWALLPPIGRAIANTQIYILDECLQPLPVGVPGELYIGGVCLARGYLNRPELTQEKFISNPFGGSKGERLYKTGDLARYLPDGNIEYLGRIDNQVKIRGFRIELGEVEAVLSQYENVQVCCAIAREDYPGDKRLVAYLVPQSEKTPTVSELRSFLKSKLPEYMVPSAIVILESLPLTPNGKVDRRALPAPFNSNSSDTFVFPRNTIELQLIQIWSKILKVDNIGVKDNFFDLGGHSLLAPYLMTQIKQQFDKDIPLAILFQHPTIEDLASLLQKDSDASDGSPLVAIQPTGSNPPFFCFPGAGGFPFYFYNLARCLGSNQPFYSFQPQNRDGELAGIRQIEDIATQYLKVIQTVQPQGPYFLGGHSFGGKVAFEIAQQLLRQGEVVALVAIFDTIAPIAQPEMEEMDDVQWLIQTAKLFQIGFTKDLDMDVDPLLSLALDEQFKYVLDYLKMLDILPPDADTTYLKRLVQAFKTDGKAHDKYVPQKFEPIAISLFRASESYQEKSAALQQFEILQDLDWGWSKFSSEPLDVQFVPGNHVTMMNQPHVQVLAERLEACINKAMKKTSPS